MRILGQVVASRVGGRADIEQDKRTLLRGHLHGQRRPIDARQSLQVQDRRRDPCAGVAGGDHRIGAALADEAHAHIDRGISLAPDGTRRLLIHPDEFGRMNDRRIRRQRPRRFRDTRLITDQEDLVGRMLARVAERPGDDLARRVIPAHRVDRDANGGRVRGGRNRGQVQRIPGLGLIRRTLQSSSSARSPAGRCSSRTPGRRGGAASERGSEDIPS